MTFPVCFPIDFAFGKPAGKVANSDHVTMGYCKPIAKYPDCDNVTALFWDGQNFKDK